MNTNDGGPAFPAFRESEYGDGGATFRNREDTAGMSLRDYFAAHALNGFMANHHRAELQDIQGQSDAYAHAAYLMADAMLKERAK